MSDLALERVDWHRNPSGVSLKYSNGEEFTVHAALLHRLLSNYFDSVNVVAVNGDE